jgi:hypothetical protein
MNRSALAALVLAAAFPAAAQETGGVHARDPSATLRQIDANRGCAMSSTNVTVGVNKATSAGSSTRQKLATKGGGGPSDCQPLVSTQVVTGVNMGLGKGSTAGQTIDAKGQPGTTATTTYTRGYNVGYGASSTATQHISNQTGR